MDSRGNDNPFGKIGNGSPFDSALTNVSAEATGSPLGNPGNIEFDIALAIKLGGVTGRPLIRPFVSAVTSP